MSANNPIKKLMIVDDSKVSRTIIRAHILAAKPEWQILEAINGNEAITMAEQEKPDYCTMDINMPGMLGTDAAKQILAAHPEIRVVIFSANIQETSRSRATDLGAIFVAKPVTEKSVNLALEYFAGK